MKRCTVLFVVALIASIFGGFFGHFIAQRSQLSPDREYYLLHEGFVRQARVYMRFIHAEDSAKPEQITDLRRQALGIFRVYVQEVAYMQAQGFQWAPIDSKLDAFAQAYVEAHPSKD